ncbi:hypothetical protein LM602_08560 [Candidatus Acetothermia bacterium]|jgi:hypothetical protein|nr:hypothetical protein [Candidatus Acetothermia bacterium]MCI2432575.1 hypothetical protein [Candidatus Acetothermia bacterium]MCI2436417.1 hypothetical protein [Candidatus Acetothermia bacterium]
MHRYFLVVVLVVITGFLSAPAQEGPSWVEAISKSYRFSLENVTHLALFSGLGVESPEAPKRWAILLERARIENLPWQNLYLNSAPFAEGLPVLTQKFRPTDAATLRWERSTIKETVEPEGLAWTVIAYISWLRQIEQGCQRTALAPRPLRFIAMTLGDLSSQALQFAEKNLKDTQTGLYGQAWAAQIAMLHALSAFALGTTDSEFYIGELSSVAARARADALFQSILKEYDPPWPTELRLQALWLGALAWYALVGSYTTDAVRLLHRLGSQWEGAASPHISTRAALVTALLTVSRLTGESSYAEKARQLWEGLKNSWELETELSVTEMGDLVGAFNAVIRVLKLEEAKSEYARFFSFWVERLQLANDEESLGRDDGIIPRMTQAGGPYGRAPVLVTRVAYDEEKKRWRLLDGRFSTAGALYAASRLLWLSGSCGEGFSGPPAYGLPQSSWIKLAAITEQAQPVAPVTPPTTTAQPPVAPPAPATGPSSQDLKELAELRLQLEVISKQVADLEKKVRDQAERLQRAEQEIAELHQSPQTEIKNLQQQMQQSKDLSDALKLRVERLEQRTTEFPWVWLILALLVVGAVGWLYLRVRRRESGEFV